MSKRKQSLKIPATNHFISGDRTGNGAILDTDFPVSDKITTAKEFNLWNTLSLQLISAARCSLGKTTRSKIAFLRLKDSSSPAVPIRRRRAASLRAPIRSFLETNKLSTVKVQQMSPHCYATNSYRPFPMTIRTRVPEISTLPRLSRGPFPIRRRPPFFPAAGARSINIFTVEFRVNTQIRVYLVVN